MALMARQSAYFAYGMHLCSDLVLPELAFCSKSPVPGEQVVIKAGDHGRWPSIEPSEHSTRTLQMAEGDWRLELEGIGWFRASAGNCLEWERWDDSVSDRDLRTFLVSSGLGALAIQRGELVLHGTTLVKDGKAVLLLGSPGSGKSCLAWNLLQKDWQLLSSEVSVVNELGAVWPGVQQLKLWKESAKQFGICWQELPLVRRGLMRYAILPPQLPVANQPTPLTVIYGLESRTKETLKSGAEQPSGTSESNHLVVHRIGSQREALLWVRNQAFHPRFYRAMQAEANLFLQASRIISHVGGYGLRVPEGIKQMCLAMEEVDLLQPEELVIKTTEKLEQEIKA